MFQGQRGLVIVRAGSKNLERMVFFLNKKTTVGFFLHRTPTLSTEKNMPKVNDRGEKLQKNWLPLNLLIR